MSAPLSDERREIIPRWRDLQTTMAAGELTPSRRGPTPIPADFLRDKLADWRREQTLPFANEVIGAALVLGRIHESKDAANFVLANRSQATSAAIVLAERILTSPYPGAQSNLNLQTPREAIRTARIITRSHPRNAFAWVELARNYATVGVMDKAIRAITVALSLGPDNRHILRSGARLYTHQGNRDRAHQLLRDSDATPYDPWLLAAELSTASLAGKTPRFTKVARQLLEAGKFSSFELAELASALGTLDAKAADLRRARKLFRLALEQPNENVVAQARWAATQTFISLDPTVLQTPRAFEARAWYDFYEGAWDAALDAGKQWLQDQPFSASPAIHTSYIASVALEDHNEALRIIDDGLVANPNDPSLLNNRAYALANLGRIVEARAMLSQIKKLPAERLARMKPVLQATAGLLAYRSGQPQQGRVAYTAAVEAAQRAGNKRLAAKAALFFALEELRLQTADDHPIAQAVALSAEFTTSDFMVLRERAQQQLQKRNDIALTRSKKAEPKSPGL
jgi:tetratricopeptide (TPR) repeat protein